MQDHPVAITYRGVVYKRNPLGAQRAHRVYYVAPRGSGRDSLHRDIWRAHNGRDIPDGWHIHHKDHDPFNNDPRNLTALSPAGHGEEHAAEFLDARRDHIERIRPLAAAWHGSPEGIRWHKEHGRQTWEVREPVGRRTCESCGNEFEAWFERARYCSRKCIDRTRERKYLEAATCPVCGNSFERDRYRKSRPETCSRKCGAQWRKTKTATAQ